MFLATTSETQSEQRRGSRRLSRRADYLGLNETDVTDWRFVSLAKYRAGRGDARKNNTFVITIAKRRELAEASKAR